MKKTILWGMALCLFLALALAGCGGSAASSISDDFAEKVETNSESPSIRVFAGDIEIERVVGLNTWDGAIIEEWDGISDEALESIYEDDFYRCCLSSIRSHLIMLNFLDGRRISLSEAISQNMVGIDELIANGLQIISVCTAE